MKSHNFKFHPLALAAVGIITLFLVAACGGGSDQPGPTSGISQPTSTSTPIERAQTGPSNAANTDAQAEEATTRAKAPEAKTNEQTSQVSPEPTPIVPTESRETGTNSPDSIGQETTDNDRTIGGAVGDQSPEFRGIVNWINSLPLTMESLRGQVVLIDFWTYTCVNCIRTFPALRDWHAKYADKGLRIIGVHTPEFEFEKVTENVVKNASQHELTWPIAQDNNFGTWRAYNNRYWPAKYLIDQDGVVRYTHFGEGAYEETEKQIRNLLAETGADLSDIEVNSSLEAQVDTSAFTLDRTQSLTREIYGGFSRNSSGTYVFHQEYYAGPDQALEYNDPGDHQNHFVYLQGPWTNGDENLRHSRETLDYSDYLALKFFANSVNAVIDPEGGEPFEVQVTIDGRPLRPEESGADLIVEDGP